MAKLSLGQEDCPAQGGTSPVMPPPPAALAHWTHLVVNAPFGSVGFSQEYPLIQPNNSVSQMNAWTIHIFEMRV